MARVQRLDPSGAPMMPQLPPPLDDKTIGEATLRFTHPAWSREIDLWAILRRCYQDHPGYYALTIAERARLTFTAWRLQDDIAAQRRGEE